MNRIKRAPKILAAACLYFRKDKRLPMTTYKIDLPSPWSTEIPAEDSPSQSAEMSGGFPFTPPAKTDMPFRS